MVKANVNGKEVELGGELGKFAEMASQVLAQALDEQAAGNPGGEPDGFHVGLSLRGLELDIDIF